MKKWAIFFVIISLIPAYFLLNGNNEMTLSERPTIIIKTKILDRFVDYIQDNNLTQSEARIRERQSSDRIPEYLIAPETPFSETNYSGIIVDYNHDTCRVVLPAGRQTKFMPIGGFIDEIEHIFPLETLSWDEMQAEKDRLISLFDNAGWARSRGYYTSQVPFDGEVTPEDFAVFPEESSKWTSVGDWEQCDNPMIKAYLEVRHYNSSASGSFMPPAPLSQSINPFAEDRYLFLIRIHTEYNSRLGDELRALRKMRRLEVHNGEDKSIQNSLWLDDPDWRPEGWDGQYIK